MLIDKQTNTARHTPPGPRIRRAALRFADGWWLDADALLSLLPRASASDPHQDTLEVSVRGRYRTIEC